MRAEPDATARRWVYEEVEGLWESAVRLFVVWVDAGERSVARADMNGLGEADVAYGVRAER